MFIQRVFQWALSYFIKLRMETFLSIIALLCGIAGIIGSIVPILPGPALAFIGLVCAYFGSAGTITTSTLWVWGIVTIVVCIMDYILPAYFSRMFGGSKAGMMGATIGIFAGMFMGPIGVIVGPFAGAVLGEMISEHRTLDEALKVGFGSFLSFIVGTGIKLVVTVMMTYYIARDLIQQIADLF